MNINGRRIGFTGFCQSAMTPMPVTVLDGTKKGQALGLARLHDSDLQVIDVGSGTGFKTQGIVKSVNARQVVCVDQSPHQQQEAKAKLELNPCTFSLGDAERIPYETDCFDRYVSAGSLNIGRTRNKVVGMCYLVAVPETLLPRETRTISSSGR